jgi:hypothetical protein
MTHRLVPYDPVADALLGDRRPPQNGRPCAHLPRVPPRFQWLPRYAASGAAAFREVWCNAYCHAGGRNGGVCYRPRSIRNCKPSLTAAGISRTSAGLLPPRGDRRLVALGGLPGRDLHAPPDPVQQQAQPRQRVSHPEPAAHHLGDPRQRPALILQAQAAGPVSSTAPSSHTCAGLSLQRAPPAPVEASAAGHYQPAPAASGSPTSGAPGTAGPPPGR